MHVHSTSGTSGYYKMKSTNLCVTKRGAQSIRKIALDLQGCRWILKSFHLQEEPKKHITSRLPSDTSSVKGGSGERFTGLMELSCLPCFNELRQDAWKNARQFNCAFALCLLNRENHSSIGNSLRRQDPTFHGWKLGS